MCKKCDSTNSVTEFSVLVAEEELNEQGLIELNIGEVVDIICDLHDLTMEVKECKCGCETTRITGTDESGETIFTISDSEDKLKMECDKTHKVYKLLHKALGNYAKGMYFYLQKTTKSTKISWH